eukprot:TRINITY_DN6050_c0_g1_i2.p1 TRINITY_DN6050_c0_g1~~TRINITY_DN6050_c0_g1_i2.p1  ORF type:complete len:207 (+),score=20.25 TRINITY_DN6050_c0_g1_i2:43-663(+)
MSSFPLICGVAAGMASICFDACVAVLIITYSEDMYTVSVVVSIAVMVLCGMALYSYACFRSTRHAMMRKVCVAWACTTIFILLGVWMVVLAFERDKDQGMLLVYICICRLVDVSSFIQFQEFMKYRINPDVIANECTLNELTNIYHESAVMWKGTTCCLCLEELHKSDLVVELRCHHVTHANCAKHFFRTRARHPCPMQCHQIEEA